MNNLRTAAAALFLVLSAISVPAADMPVKDGLIFWFNAQSQPALRSTNQLPSLTALQPADIIFDASPAKARAYQPAAEKRPTFMGDAEAAYLKFDGKDDSISFTPAAKSTKALTVFNFGGSEIKSWKFLRALRDRATGQK